MTVTGNKEFSVVSSRHPGEGRQVYEMVWQWDAETNPAETLVFEGSREQCYCWLEEHKVPLYLD